MKFTISEVTERYCPVIKSNVYFEISHSTNNCNTENCMNSHICEKEHGGCKNRYIKTGQ